jgi:hypothetical protein
MLYERRGNTLRWGKLDANQLEALNDSAAWFAEYLGNTGYYRFRNAATGKYITHSGTSVTLATSASGNSNFQLMPGRNTVVVTGLQNGMRYSAQSYWLTWTQSGDKSMQAGTYNETLAFGPVSVVDFNYSNTAKQQRYIFVSEDDIATFVGTPGSDAIHEIATQQEAKPSLVGIYSAGGARLQQMQRGINVMRYSDGTSRVVIR